MHTTVVAVSKYVYAFGLLLIMLLSDCNFMSDLPGSLQMNGRYVTAIQLFLCFTRLMPYSMFVMLTNKMKDFTTNLPFCNFSLKLDIECNEGCNCGTVQFLPICFRGTSHQQTYFSPCHAGCREAPSLNGSVDYSSCMCVS